MRKLTAAEVKRRLRKINSSIKVISKYKNSVSKLKCRCKCGNEWYVTWGDLSQGIGCPECAINRRIKSNLLTHEEAVKRIYKSNPMIKILGKYYRNHSPLKCKCLACNHIWYPRYNDLLKGCGCVKCSYEYRGNLRRYDIKKVKKELRKINSNIRIVGGTYNNNQSYLKCKCSVCKKIWNSKWADLRQGHGCPRCGGTGRLSLAEVRDRLSNSSNQNIKVSGNYETIFSILNFRCLECEHKWKTNWYLMRGRCICPKCQPHKFGASEEKVRRIIENLTGWRFPRKRPAFLKGWSTQPMELDGYNKRHKVAFEYNGEGRKFPIWGEKAFETTKRNDKRKRELCRYYGITLIVVPYWKQDVTSFLKKKLKEANVAA